MTQNTSGLPDHKTSTGIKAIKQIQNVQTNNIKAKRQVSKSTGWQMLRLNTPIDTVKEHRGRTNTIRYSLNTIVKHPHDVAV